MMASSFDGFHLFMRMVFTVILVTLCMSKDVLGMCYFPAAYQGEYVTQAIMSAVPTIAYSKLTVQFDSIPIWGVCHRRIGNNIILVDEIPDGGDNSYSGTRCFKCFNLVLRSANVLQIHTSGLDKCYTNEEKAMADCPSDITIRERRSREIMLYRTKGFMGEPAVSPTYCPINGAYSFTYSVNDGTENSLECGESPMDRDENRRIQSEISDCPYGFRLNLKFKGCSFGNMDMSFHCLGDWEGSHKGERYIALMDTQATAAPSRSGRQNQFVEESIRPRYRCALYTENDETGEIKLALSSDSTCANHLRSPTDGYETLTLNPIPLGPWPAHIMKHSYRTGRGSISDATECALPDWAQGKWEHIHVVGGTVLLKDHRDFKTYTARCVGHSTMRRGRQQEPAEEIFLMYARTQCGDEHYKCVWLKHRGYNALEFQLGLYTSPTHNESLCDPENFQDRRWTTQGRAVVEEPTPYPIIGEYTGVIPDTDTPMCAKLYSDCNNPEIMFYTIFNCFNRSEVFEEREYRCLGQWTEDGMIYTYTERRDMIGHECFVGVLTAKGDIYLLEAGQNCERGHEPMKFGMRLTQVSKCYGSHHPKLKTWQQQLRRLEQGHSTTENPAWASDASDVQDDRSHHRKAQALPTSWRERELLNNNYSYSGSSKAQVSNSVVIIFALVSLFYPISTFLLRTNFSYSSKVHRTANLLR